MLPPSEIPTIEFQTSGKSEAWDESSHSLLDFAEEQGLFPPFSCRSGICSTCRTKVISGDVEYFEEPLDPPEEGYVLICCSRPKGSLVLDL